MRGRVRWCLGARSHGLHYSWLRIGDWIIRLQRLSHPTVKDAVGPWCYVEPHRNTRGVQGTFNAEEKKHG